MNPHAMEPSVPFCHALALNAARTGLNALAAQADNPQAASAYQQVHATLDATCGLTGSDLDPDRVPGVCLGTMTDQLEIFAHTATFIEQLITYGVDELVVELVLAMLVDARELDLYG